MRRPLHTHKRKMVMVLLGKSDMLHAPRQPHVFLPFFPFFGDVAFSEYFYVKIQSIIQAITKSILSPGLSYRDDIILHIIEIEKHDRWEY